MKNLYQKMTDIMKTIKSVKKGETISMGRGSYSAVGHDDVAALLHGPLAEAGIWVRVSVIDCHISSTEKVFSNGNKGYEYRSDVWVEVTFINADAPEERESVKSFAYAFDSSDKATGKAESMAVKYAFLKNFTLESVDEEESREHEQKSAYTNKPSYQEQKPQFPQKSDDIPPTEKQKEFIRSLCEQTGKPFVEPKNFKHAQDLINRLKEIQEENKKPAKPTFKI
jgi:uncharacterized lipoprotein YddW (UPF0748 family)